MNIDTANATLYPLIQELGTPSFSFIEEQDWITNVVWLGNWFGAVNGVGALNTTLAPDVHDDFYAASTFVYEKEPLGASSIDAFMEYLYGPGQTTEIEWFILM